MITVCIPAYRAEDFIAETVASVLAQTLDEFRLEIAIDPPDDAPDKTEEALDPVRNDPRISIRVNPVRLGWAANIDAMLSRVRTEFYAILPHDDLWSPEYLARLLPLVSSDREASVAYADLEIFGAGPVGKRRAVVLPRGEDRATHLIRFLLQGAHAIPWRGVTRRSALSATEGFPTDDWSGFAVECEYALGLLQAGVAVHVPECLYRKRRFDDRHASASRERRRSHDSEARLNAFRAHHAQMHRRVESHLRALDAPREISALARLALAAAMLRRRANMAGAPVQPEERPRVAAVAQQAAGLAHPLAGDVAVALKSLA